VEPRSFAEAVAGLECDAGAVTAAPTPCNERLAAMAEIEPMPRLIGPGACGGLDLVLVNAVVLTGKTRVAITPAPLLHCAMAESLAAWLREEVAPRAAKLGSQLKRIENYDSYQCRSRNRRPGAKLSEHAHGNALDLRAIHLADGRRFSFTDVTVDKSLRDGLRESACQRFTTVLGPGDPHHEEHIHLDVIQRRSGYRICQWEVRTPPPPPPKVAVGEVDPSVPLPRPRPAIGQRKS
jgi:hypothetical protein